MNIDLVNQLYRDLYEAIERKGIYGARVTQKSLKQSDKFPLITVTEEDNKNVLTSLDFKDRTDQILININIYAQDKSVDNKTISNVNIVRELMQIVDNICQTKYRLLRDSCKPTPNLDNTIYRVTARYRKKIISNKNLFI